MASNTNSIANSNNTETNTQQVVLAGNNTSTNTAAAVPAQLQAALKRNQLAYRAEHQRLASVMRTFYLKHIKDSNATLVNGNKAMKAMRREVEQQLRTLRARYVSKHKDIIRFHNGYVTALRLAAGLPTYAEAIDTLPPPPSYEAATAGTARTQRVQAINSWQNCSAAVAAQSPAPRLDHARLAVQHAKRARLGRAIAMQNGRTAPQVPSGSVLLAATRNQMRVAKVQGRAQQVERLRRFARALEMPRGQSE
ncbi:hypothetical protein LTR85_000551 [Meristemomyces frigidus]|nr:hypothetical protein LTR85_000551 [Meristemomyces frigidus]